MLKLGTREGVSRKEFEAVVESVVEWVRVESMEAYDFGTREAGPLGNLQKAAKLNKGSS